MERGHPKLMPSQRSLNHQFEPSILDRCLIRENNLAAAIVTYNQGTIDDILYVHEVNASSIRMPLSNMKQRAARKKYMWRLRPE